MRHIESDDHAKEYAADKIREIAHFLPDVVSIRKDYFVVYAACQYKTMVAVVRVSIDPWPYESTFEYKIGEKI
jgi:hypothetical protein